MTKKTIYSNREQFRVWKKNYPNFEGDNCVPISHYGKSKNLATKFIQKK